MQAVHRVDQVRKLHGLPYLVGLQMANQMPGHAIADLGKFALGLLHAVLAHICGAGSNGLPHGSGIMVLGHRHQRNRRIF